MKKMKTLRLIHIVLTMLVAAAVLVVSPMTASAVQLLNSADTYGENLAPTTNFGANDFVTAKSWGAGPNRKSYLKWDLSSITSPVTTATLRLQGAADSLTGTGLSGGVYLLNDGDVGESWGEMTLTWNNAPANITTSGVLFDGARSTLLGNISVTDPRTVGDYWTLSGSSLVDAINNDTDNNLTFMIATNIEGPSGLTFGSKEDTDGNPAQGWTTPFDGATLFLDETPPAPAPDPPPGLGRGHRILMQKGLQIQAQVFVTKPVGGFDLNTWADSGFTTLNFQYDSDDQGTPAVLAAAPADQQWGRVRGAFHLNPGELVYEENLVSVQHQDDNVDLSDPSQLGTAISTLADLRSRHPDTLSFTNQGVATVDDMRLYMDAAQPDMLMNSSYVFNNVPHPGGSPTALYGKMQERRLLGLRGNDYSGNRPIPYGRYIQSIVYGDDPMSESEIRLEHFSSWAFGYKFLSAFTYNSAYTDPTILPPLLFDGLGDDNPSASFPLAAETNRQSINLGPALVRLVSTDLRFVLGSHMDGTPTQNSLPNLTEAWTDTADPYITGISATNLGTKNDGLEGDVIVGYFNPLLESFDGPNFTDEIYFMIVNGLTDSDGSAAETQQEIRLDFDFLSSGITSLQRLSRDTGVVEDVTLMSDGGALYHLDLILDGGTGDLFKFNTGATFIVESGRTWANAVSSDWSADANWDGGVAPNANDVSVIFASAITTPGTVFTNSAVTVESIQFGELDDNGATQSYAIAGQGSVNLESSTSNASIDVIDGTHQFQTVVNLVSPTNVNVAASSSLAFNNVLNLNGQSLTKTGDGTLSINNQLNGGGGSFSAIAGVISGSGMIASDLNNDGATVAPGNSPGMLSVGGNYLQTAGLLSIEIGGTNDGSVSGVREFDLLNVSDDLTILGGSLVVTMIDGFAASLGDTFDILDFDTIDLSGAALDLSSPGAGLVWDSSQLTIDGSLTVVAAAVPEPTSACLMIVSLSAVFAAGRRRR